MTRLFVYLVGFTLALAGSLPAHAKSETSRTTTSSPAKQATQASATILSGVSVRWSSPTSEGITMHDPSGKRTAVRTIVKRRDADGKVQEIVYVEFT